MARFEDSAYAVRTIEDLREGVSVLIVYFSNEGNNDVELPSGEGRDIAINALRRTLEEIGKEQDLTTARSLVFEWAHKYLEGSNRIGRLRMAVAKIAGQELRSPLLRHIMYLINSSTARIRNPHAFDETPLALQQIMWEHEYIGMMAQHDLGLDAIVSSVLERLDEDFSQRGVSKEIEVLEADIARLEKDEASAHAAILKSRAASRKFRTVRERLDDILMKKRALEQRRHDFETVRDARQRLIAIRSFLPLKQSPNRMTEEARPSPNSAVSSI